MRRNRSRFLWAVATSLACHGLVVALYFLVVPGIRSSRAQPAGIVTKIAPYEFQIVAARLDEPPPIRGATVSETPPVAAPKKIASESKNKMEDVKAPPTALANPSKTSDPIGKAAPQIAPLHGPLTTPGLSIVYVLDRSGSMAQAKKLAHAIAVLKASLRQLGPDVRFQIVTYDSQASIARLMGNLELVSANARAVAEAEKLLDDLAAEGSSRHSEGLRVGLGLHPDLLILLSDAGELSSRELKQIKRWNAKGTAIHAVLIGVTNDDGVATLRELTGPGHIHFVSLPAPSALTP